MSFPKRWFTVVLTLLILSTLSVSVSAQEDALPSRSGLRPDAPPYGVRGPHPVGARDITIDTQSGLEGVLWYPALNPDGAVEAITYTNILKFSFAPIASTTLPGHALRDALADLSAGPYPLVVLSPGFALGNTTYAWLAEHLASYGFVVISPDHQERYEETFSDNWRAVVRRPKDVLAVMAYVDDVTATGGMFEGLIDTDLVAVVGHSSGGYTALAAAGGRIDVAGFTARCEAALAAKDPDAWLCGIFLPNVSNMADLAGLDPMPDGLWPSRAVPGVDAVVALAGESILFNQAGLAEITIPVMSIGGTHDFGTPFEWGALPIYKYVSSAKKILVAFEGADHMIFGTKCDDLPIFEEVGFYLLCSDPVWDMDRAHDLTNHFTTAFLLAELKRDTEAVAALAPEAVQFPAVTYEAKGF
jgi:predicted dienelactone hydrolase